MNRFIQNPGSIQAYTNRLRIASLPIRTFMRLRAVTRQPTPHFLTLTATALTTNYRSDGDRMMLTRGITGFWNVRTAPPPFLDETVFRQMCHTLALQNGGTVSEVDTDHTAKNFYVAKIQRYDDSVFILQNIHDPYAAFAQRNLSGGFTLSRQPKWLQLPEGLARFLRPDELHQDWHALCGDLDPEELEQIRYWNPQTVGEIIFNTWD